MTQQWKRSILLPAAGLLSAGVLAAPAHASTVRASFTDPTGDGPVPGRDITEVKFRYSTTGSILFVITVAGPIDAANADAGVGVSLGKNCRTLQATGSGLFSQPDPTVFFRVKGQKLGHAKKGEGKIASNVYSMVVKAPVFKGLRPTCFAVALVDPTTPSDQAPVPFDQTGEVKLKKG